jgi:hypothetical protein
MGGCSHLQACRMCKLSGSFHLARITHKQEGRFMTNIYRTARFMHQANQSRQKMPLTA